MNMKLYGLHGHLTADKGKGDTLLSILISASKMLKGKYGCQMYMVGRDAENHDKIWVTEVWDNQESHANSLQLTEVQELIQKAIPILLGAPEKGTTFHVVADTL